MGFQAEEKFKIMGRSQKSAANEEHMTYFQEKMRLSKVLLKKNP